MNKKITIHWFRRDLRLEDNAGLYHALKNHKNVLPLFIFDAEILEHLADKSDQRITFIYDCIQSLNRNLTGMGSGIIVRYGKPLEVWKELINEFEIESVYTNHDYEPYAIDRDNKIENLLTENQIPLFSYKDQVIFEKEEVLKDDGTPYTIFTPFSKKWKLKINDFFLQSYPTENYFPNFLKINEKEFISIEEIGFKKSERKTPSPKIDLELLKHYHETRDFPCINGTSKLSVHLRFGTISIRKLMRIAKELNEKYFNELIWREFYQMILFHFPFVVTQAFKKEYDNIQWRNNENEFAAWCEGRTGFPIVDAGMRELNETGFMHNRVRMITASFLTKDLLIDWRWGEAYFAEKLLDYELASNNGGWQWAAGSGVDAAPYFRIFNPHEQTKKFDPEWKYIRTWVKDIDELSYPQQIVDHAFARQRTLKAYQIALRKG